MDLHHSEDATGPTIENAVETPTSEKSEEPLSSEATLADPNSKKNSVDPATEKILESPSSGKQSSSPPQEKGIEEPISEKPEIEQKPRSAIQRIKLYLISEVTVVHADLIFILCCFISGLVDSTIYDSFGTFVSMQTGNTVFLGLGGATPHTTSKPYGWAKSLVSIGFFCTGCLVFTHTTRFFGNLRRVTVAGSFLAQALIIFIAAAVVQGGSVNGSLHTITDDINWWDVLPIALLSFQAAGQIVGSRAVSLSEVPTVVVTSMLHDIFSDPKLLAGLSKNVKRNRRIGAFFALLIGAVAGGFIGENTKRMQVPLWIAGAIKLGITAAWMTWPEKKIKAT